MPDRPFKQRLAAGFKHLALTALALVLAAAIVGLALLFQANAPAAPAPQAAPAIRQAEVCVYAATPSGILAAVAVAREGRSVILIEPSRWIGGILGAGIKPGQDCPNKDAVGGLAKEVILKGGKSPRKRPRLFPKTRRAIQNPDHLRTPARRAR